MKKLAFIIFSTITFYCNSQEKIILTNGDTLVGKVSEVDELRSRIKKPDGTSVLILTNMIKSLNGIPTVRDQSNILNSPEPKTIARLSILVPGFSVEQKIAKNTTLIFNLWTGFAYRYTSINGNSTSSLDFEPNFTIEPRFYTNLEKRKSIGKRTDYFSGAYIGIPITIGFSDSRFAAGPVGGFQTALGKKGYWNIAFGLGILGNQNETQVGLIGNLGLGFILN